MHRGHIESLKFCKSKGDKLVVAINSDESVRREKGPSRPVVSQENRMAIMAAIGCVDFVVLFEEDTPLETIKIIRPDVLAKGGDYKIENIIGADIVSEVYQAPMVLGVSTSIMLENHFLHKQS
jgi:D-beta-D-heptose 7-phosphate kinase/D-beta-D-heptose 1-phosphate adenosyltransferase